MKAIREEMHTPLFYLRVCVMYVGKEGKLLRSFSFSDYLPGSFKLEFAIVNKMLF